MYFLWCWATLAYKWAANVQQHYDHYPSPIPDTEGTFAERFLLHFNPVSLEQLERISKGRL